MRPVPHLFAVTLALAVLACSSKTEPAPARPAPAATPAPVAEAPPAPAATPAATPQPAATPTPAATPAAEPAPAKTTTPSKTTAPAKETPPAKATAPVKETPPATATAPATSTAPATPSAPSKPAEAPAPAKVEAPAPTKSAHAAVGAARCKMCHKVQFESWSASAHAAKGLDCEGCHGNGADYIKASVMRDRAASVAGGLVLQDIAACRKCHPGADASLLPKAHAHKAN